jgi:hypothetical protein
MRAMRIAGMACALAACSRAEQAPASRTDAAPAADTAPSAAVDAARTGGAGDTVRIHPTLPPYGFALHGGQPGAVDSIVVTSAGERVQTLRPADNLLPEGMEPERLSMVDLDFDGYADLAFLNSVAMANSRSEYWRFDPGTRRFADVGEYETLVADSAAREWTTFNRGGHGGRLWTAARWRWEGGRLVAVAEEEQMSVDGEGGYVHVVRRARDGAMAEVERHTLQGDSELRAGPSWMKP